jgi:hypothetical protein
LFLSLSLTTAHPNINAPDLFELNEEAAVVLDAPRPPPGSYKKAREVARKHGHCLGTSGTPTPEAPDMPLGNSKLAVETSGRSLKATEAADNIIESGLLLAVWTEMSPNDALNLAMKTTYPNINSLDFWN